jgi:hypothetical protein
VPHPQAALALVLGILGTVLGLGCIVGGLVGIGGIVLGRRVKNDIDADPGRYSGRSQAVAGMITGIVGVSITVLATIFIVLAIVAGIAEHELLTLPLLEKSLPAFKDPSGVMRWLQISFVARAEFQRSVLMHRSSAIGNNGRMSNPYEEQQPQHSQALSLLISRQSNSRPLGSPRLTANSHRCPTANSRRCPTASSTERRRRSTHKAR